jgi:hypothetical protein
MFLAKVFEKNSLTGGQSAGPRWTVRYLPRNQTERCAARWTEQTVHDLPADSPRGLGGQSEWSWRVVCPAQRALLTAVDFAFLPLEFKCGQSARTSRTFREVRVFHITASNGKGEYLYSMSGLGEALLAL